MGSSRMSTGRSKPTQQVGAAAGRVRQALEATLGACPHLTDMDQALVELARCQADKLDAWDVIVRWAGEDAGPGEDGKRGVRPAVPQNDNVTPTVFLKVLTSLGLTPEARGVFDVKLKGVLGATQQAVPASAPFDPSTA